MSEIQRRAHVLGESLAPYAVRDSSTGVTKLSVSLPTELVEVIRATAAESGLSVSATIAAAIQRTLGDAEQAQLDAALELDRDENVAFAEAYAPIAAELIAKLTW